MNSINYAGEVIVSLPVIDLVKSERWYRDVLRFETVRALEEPPWREMRAPLADITIGLAEVAEVRIGDITLSLAVENLENCRRVLSKARADISEIVEVEGVARVFSVLDPDGHTIMLRENAG